MARRVAHSVTPVEDADEDADALRQRELWLREAPGLWCALHVGAARSSADTRAAFARLVDDVVASIRCSKCRAHARAYVADNPPARADEDPFTWAWRFHNAVNARLGKPLVGWASAWREYAYAVAPQSTDADADCSAACQFETPPPAQTQTQSLSELSRRNRAS